jgi:protein disulfide-isomerase-like protein
MLKTISLLTVLTATQAIELTIDNYEEQTMGKTVFIKMFAPWCGHCKAMKPDWDELMDEYADSTSVLIADVDCIGDGKALCDKHGVQGFPSVKWGAPGALEDYKGGRDKSSLSAFAAGLQPQCDVKTLENCSKLQLEDIELLGKESEEALQLRISTYDQGVAAIAADFKQEVTRLQGEYTTLMQKKDTATADLVRTSKIPLIKALLAVHENKNEL